MKSINLLPATLATLLSGPTLACTTQVSQTQVNAAQASEIPAQHLLSSIQEITGVPGMSAAVSKDGQIVWSGSVGLMDISEETPVDEQTKFRIASVSKLFTATLILKLAEDGLVDLDADIRRYIPDWSDHNGAVITLRQLAAHISGIEHYGAGDRYDSSADYTSLVNSLSIYAHKRLAFQPGEAYSYSSYGYALMGAVIETVTGKSFADNLDALLQPLELNNTAVEAVHQTPENTSKLYLRGGTEVIRNSQAHVNGATGILSTPSDLVQFANAYAAGDIVGPATINMSFEAVTLNNETPAGIDRFSVGFGWRIGLDWDDKRVVHHAGTTRGARSILSYNRDLGTAVAVLSNAQWTSRIESTGEFISTAAIEGSKLSPDDCPEGRWDYEGVFILDADNPPENNNEYGYILVEQTNGVCSGKIHSQDALAGWLTDRDARTDFMTITLIATRQNNEKVFAAATPWGASPFRWSKQPDGVNAIADIAGRRLELHLFNDSTIP